MKWNVIFILFEKFLSKLYIFHSSNHITPPQNNDGKDEKNLSFFHDVFIQKRTKACISFNQGDYKTSSECKKGMKREKEKAYFCG
jgi:hypothetical protein